MRPEVLIPRIPVFPKTFITAQTNQTNLNPEVPRGYMIPNQTHPQNHLPVEFLPRTISIPIYAIPTIANIFLDVVILARLWSGVGVIKSLGWLENLPDIAFSLGV
jgi:hypothetical protein